MLRDNQDENRIASPELVLRSEALPHLKCSRATSVAEQDDEDGGMATRAELVSATRGRSAVALRAQKKQILDKFVAVTGFHRKHAMRLLCARGELKSSGPRRQRRVYDEAVRTALIVVWEASDRICGKRLKPVIGPMVEAMERHGHPRLEAEVRTHLLAMSAATIDRALIEAKAGAGQKRRRAWSGTAEPKPGT